MTQVIDDKDLQAVLKKLDLFRSTFSKKDFETILAEAAEPALSALQDEAPQSKKAHTIKDDGGTTKRVKPGNLKRSIQIFKAKHAVTKMVLVGPIVSKKSRVKSVTGAKRISRAKRAFYWRYVYYGTARQAPNRFIDRARSKSASAVMSRLKSGIKKYAKKEIKDIFK